MSPVPEDFSKDESQFKHDEGDVYDEDAGEYLGSITIENHLPPAQLGVLINGYWYVYQPVTRYKAEDADNVHDVVTTSISAVELLQAAGELRKEEDDGKTIPRDKSILP